MKRTIKIKLNIQKSTTPKKDGHNIRKIQSNRKPRVWVKGYARNNTFIEGYWKGNPRLNFTQSIKCNLDFSPTK